MKRNEKKDLHDKSQEELKKTLSEYEKEFFEMKMEKEQGKLKNTSGLTNLRKKIAIVKTIMNQKEAKAHA
jgi:large subunit ribosomal protein L29